MVVKSLLMVLTCGKSLLMVLTCGKSLLMVLTCGVIVNGVNVW